MMGRRTFEGVLLGGAVMFGLGALSGCSLWEPSETIRYRVTVEVDTPQGVKSGYSVWELTMTDIKVGFNGAGASGDYRGEAVAVDLPGSQTLFALLTDGDGFGEYPESMIYDKLKESPEYQKPEVFLTVFPQWRAQRKSWEVTKELPGQTFTVNGQDKPRSGYPMLVTFTDITDPKSVTKVDPADLAAAFGPGVKLRRITVTVTDEAVTSGIEKRFSWWNKYSLERRRLNGSNSIAISTNELSDNIGTGEFSTGVNQ